MWTTVQHSLLASYLTLMIPRISMLLHLNYLRKRSRTNPKSIASDQSFEESDEPRIPSTKPKNHSDKSKHKSRSRYVSSSSGEDQSPVARHRSSKPSGAQPSGAVSDQDLPQHDPDPPYYREVGKTSQPSISLLPLLKLLLLAMLPLRSVNIALSQLSRRLSHRSKKMPILKRQQSVDMRKSVSTWIFGIRQFLFNTGPLHASANP